ncbi:MAG: STAS/SEC14 domain-containing protein [Chloroflexi bacterium]|nr:STAS/SEC14 domain-containing protein [Chloroflexota bacterium]
MPVVQVEAQVPTDKLLKAVGQLSQTDLEQFVFQVIALRAQRQASSLPHAESELLLKINEGVPPDIQTRYNELISKRQAETLTPDEYEELLGLTQQVEKLEVRRVEDLAELARLRGTSLTTLMQNLGIRPPAYD